MTDAAQEHPVQKFRRQAGYQYAGVNEETEVGELMAMSKFENFYDQSSEFAHHNPVPPPFLIVSESDLLLQEEAKDTIDLDMEADKAEEAAEMEKARLMIMKQEAEHIEKHNRDWVVKQLPYLREEMWFALS